MRARRAVLIGAIAVGSLMIPTAAEVAAQPAVLEVAVTPSAASPGEPVTVTITGCAGGEVAAGLWVPLAADPIVSTGPIETNGEPVGRELVVPVGAEPTTAASIVAVCSLDESFAEVPFTIVPAPVPSSTTAPPPIAPPAAGVEAAAVFTG